LARFVRGDIVAVPFPVDGKSTSRFRPALIAAAWPSGDGTDYLACAISSQPSDDPHFMEIAHEDVVGGSLGQPSFVRPSYLFAIDESTIRRRIAALTPEKLDAVLSTLSALFR